MWGCRLDLSGLWFSPNGWSMFDTVMKIWVPEKVGELLTSWMTISFSWSNLLHGVNSNKILSRSSLRFYTSINLNRGLTYVNNYLTSTHNFLSEVSLCARNIYAFDSVWVMIYRPYIRVTSPSFHVTKD